MNPGSQAFAASIEDIAASRSSLTSRSCSVPNARSTRPLACGLLAQMMSTFNASSARELSDAVAGRRILAIHPEDAVLVAVKRNRLAMCFQVGTHRPEIVERRLRGDEPKLH